MSVQILEHEGRPAFALMPIEEYERLVAALEDAHDAATIEEFYRRLVSGEEETFPAEVVDRLLAGEHPVRVLRSHRGMTLQQVADACGVTNSHISQIEKGKRSMSTELLKKMAEALRVDAEMLL
ncbi:transcriptional regulator, XRE family [Desulfarculus baarsii DSM 2075]|uniref:Transcriptional regulator, XRE family n=1 Tax=Desulfarculus baarsii (strain ATCC 33931 / DSM 2075 / LMG 7858 / VKM B-1802 / 2st14) TaxID=644282 RepID=E1QK52_DESB2|nr:helix-turn-helix transcriptional regulator [Desulfarculus baarsii]ADK85945.1 transcriptional regulator, XRE family [Desulfarculus baarsii DSM 2075]